VILIFAPEVPLNSQTQILSLFPGSQLSRIHFIARNQLGGTQPGGTQPGGTQLLEFPPPLQPWIAQIDSDSTEPCALELLSIPCREGLSAEHEQQLRAWVSKGQEQTPPPITMTLQRTTVIAADGRMVIAGQEDRLSSLTRTLTEAFFYETQLREIERLVGENWQQMEADLPSSFAASAETITDRERLSAHYLLVMTLSSRLARLAPWVHAPYLHPPTLASQLQERFRERLQMPHRHEMLDDQLEIFCDCYDAVAQRQSDYRLTQSSNQLEWIIIILLVIQVLFSVFDILSTLQTS